MQSNFGKFPSEIYNTFLQIKQQNNGILMTSLYWTYIKDSTEVYIVLRAQGIVKIM